MSWIITASAIIRGATVAQVNHHNFRVEETPVFINFSKAMVIALTANSDEFAVGRKIDIRVQRKISFDGKYITWTGHAIGELK